jgi:FeS assembly SUF system protein
MGEEKIFLEGNGDEGQATAGAAKAVQPVTPEEKRFSEGESAGRSAAADAAPAARSDAPAPVPSKQSSVPSSGASAAASAVPPAPPPDAHSKNSPSSSLAAISSSRSPLEQKVIDEALKKCFDPEIPVNIWELGLIYSVAVSPEGVAQVSMTLTAPGCPVAGSLPGEVEAKVKAVPGVTDAKVELVWEPPWNADMMSRVARVMLGM